jgi:hypothetical protein
MNVAAKATVLSIAAPPGGGKTTLSRMLSAKLSNAPIVHYDDYEKLTQRSPAEIEAWLDRGARLDEIPLSGFAEKIAALAAGGSRHVLVDAPIGRAHPPTAAMIDFLIFIDTPFDIALARVIRGQANLAVRASEPAAARNFAMWLEGYLDNYARFMRRSYEVQRATVMPQADLVLDGLLAPQRLAELSVAAISARAG